jgi:transposase
MLDQSTRTAILKLHEQGHSLRGIARVLRVSRGAVREVLRAGSSAVPRIERREAAAPYREEILNLYRSCKGNLVRVHEELVASGADFSYQALTAFCRRQGIGQEVKEPVGRYEFEPGQEMQHDTSPHLIQLGGQQRRVQTASLVLCYSRMIFFQFYPNFQRFHCKVFLTDALHYLDGSCSVCMIDNTHLVVLQGTGRDMVPVPEMQAFAERYHFAFQAHEKGDANRSARVERRFSYIENNFLAGRAFRDWEDANRQAREWCDKVNGTFRAKLKASARELFAIEQAYLKPLPLWVPPVYLLHQRIVDVEGYVSVSTNRYSVPVEMISRRVEVRESKDSIEIYEGPRLIATHPRIAEPTGRHFTLAEHRHPRGRGVKPPETSSEEKTLLETLPELAGYVRALKERSAGRGTLALRRLLTMVNDYPREPLQQALAEAAQYGLYDLDRVETVVLRKLSREYFQIRSDYGDQHDGSDSATAAESAPEKDGHDT